jgi:tripartite-type tricarboxylate transporter receptor subunit TctC
VLAYTGPQRSVILPEVPTVAETYPEFEMTQWYGLFAPAGTPEPVLARLRAEVSRILQQPDLRERLLGAGGIETWMTAPAEFSQAIRSDHAKFARLARELAVKID